MTKPLVLFSIVFLTLTLPLRAQGEANEIGLSFGRAHVPGFGDINAFGASYTRMIDQAFSARAGVMRFTGELDRGTFVLGDLEMDAVTAGIQYQLFRERLIAPYLGGGLAFVRSTLSETFVGDVEAEDDTTVYVSGGADFNVAPQIAISLDATYMPYQVDFRIINVDMDPLTVSMGAKYRW